MNKFTVVFMSNAIYVDLKSETNNFEIDCYSDSYNPPNFCLVEGTDVHDHDFYFPAAFKSGKRYFNLIKQLLKNIY